MLRSFRKLMVVVIAVAFVGMLAGNAAASYMYVYDFDSHVGVPLTTGALYGQDNWVKAGSGTGTLQVASGAPGWSGNYVTQVTSGIIDTQDYRTNNVNWSYTIDSTQAFDVSCVVQVGGNGSGYYYAHGGTQFYGPSASSGNNALLSGVHGSSGLWWFAGGTQASKTLASLGLTVNDDKVFRVGSVVTPTITPGQFSVQPYYENITDNSGRLYEGSPIIVSNSGTPNDYAHWNLPDWNVIQVRVGPTPGGRIDNVVISSFPVPEPSTLALLAAGLFGLLAYAWKKCK